MGNSENIFRPYYNFRRKSKPMFQIIIFTLQAVHLLISCTCFDLGENLIINSKFSQPPLANGISYQVFSSIPGWSCQGGCQINNCYLQNQQALIQRKYFGDCEDQIIDISDITFGAVTQQFQSQAGPFLLQIQYLLPRTGSDLKTLLVYFNGVEILRFKSLASRDFWRYNLSTELNISQGRNNISFNMEGLDDSYGYRLYSVSLRRIIDDQFEQILDHLLNSSILLSVIKVPAANLIFGQIVNFFVSFQRLQLYYFHNRDYSYYTKMFIAKVSNLLSQKGALSQQIIQVFFDRIRDYTEYLVQKSNYKSNYLGITMKNKPQEGVGFIQNNVNIVFYSLPFFIALMIIFYSFFRLSFDVKISRIFRKYCMKGIILLMIFDGNIQQFSFYLFGQINSLFCFSFGQKLGNIFLVFFFFLLLFASTAIYLWFRIAYKKLSTYFIQGVTFNYIGIIKFSLDKGIFCFILGAVHQILVSYPNKQLLVLAAVQSCWIFSQINGLQKKIYKQSIFVCLSISDGFLRIIFITCLYVFEISKENSFLGNFINSQVHRTIIICFLALWCILFLISILSFINGIKELFISSQIPKNAKKQKKHQENNLSKLRKTATNQYYAAIILKNSCHQRYNSGKYPNYKFSLVYLTKK